MVRMLLVPFALAFALAAATPPAIAPAAPVPHTVTAPTSEPWCC